MCPPAAADEGPSLDTERLQRQIDEAAARGGDGDILFVDCRTEAPRRDFVDRRFGRNRPWYVNENRARRYPGLGVDEPSGMSAIVV